ncbi:MAG: dihydroorotase [Christensenellales bacterium]|jgi:dihydroorotase
MILIKGGRVIDPKNNIDGILDIIIKDGKAIDTGHFSRASEYQLIIEAGGLVVAPGLIDVHVHFRDPGLTHKEDIISGAAAAAKGGYTTVVCMANTKPVIDSEDTLRYVLEKGAKTGINVMSVAAVTKDMAGRELSDMAALKAAGACGFSDDGMPLTDVGLVAEAMREAKKLGVPISLHEEDPALIMSSGVNKGVVSEKMGVGGAPAVSEDVMVARDCMLALYTGATVNIQHVSSKNSVKMIRLAKEMGARIFAEATPNHFALCEDDVLKYGTTIKVNPPLRTREDRAAIIEGLKDGTIDIIATDHAPHSREEKALPFDKAPSGILGLETALALGISVLVRGGHISLARLMEKMSVNPARLYSLDKGRLDKGAAADIVIFDAEGNWQPGEFASKSANSPFIGDTLYGKVKYTICGGKVVYKGD